MALSAQGTDRLLELIGDVSGADCVQAFRVALLAALQRAVPSRYVAYNEVDDAGVWAISEPALPADAAQRWAELAGEHPVLEHMRRTRDGRPRRISDELALPAFRRTALHARFYGPLGVHSQVAFGLPAAPPLVIGIALSRGEEDFSDEEVELLARARPHLIQAYRSARAAGDRERVLAALERGLTSGGRLALAVDRAGRVLHASPEARRAVGLPAQDGPARLDAALVAALERERRQRGSRPVPVPGGEAHLRVLPGLQEDALDVLLVERPDGGLTVERLLALGLTPREAEALRWLALGQTGPDAARAMGVRPRTVAKHLQSVYAKLGVSSRAQAAATAWAAVGPGAGAPPAERG